MKKALLRCDVYRVLALGFEVPLEKNLRELQAILQDLLEVQSLGKIFKKMLREVKRAKAQDLEEEYHLLFTTKVLCPPSEGSYHLTERGPILGDVTAFYRAFELNFLAHEGPPDSIKMELAFLSYMALKEAYAAENNMLKEAEITHEAQKSFLRDHLGRWGSGLAEKVMQNTTAPFYHSLAKFLQLWLDFENDLFKIQPLRLPVSLPRAEEEPVACAL
ncbi:MAG: molecular chaperone TorD family protein [Deltaproteobacteria bacterium]|nr:molecular chaperone TorD family protein [Deltaproteobacteria bacterium]MBI4223859.1 molecular chaperone TorD family protein [Deltaproteobacteria bacterium]